MGNTLGWLVIAALATVVYWGIAFAIGYFLNIPVILIITVAYIWHLVRQGTFARGLGGALESLDKVYWLLPVLVTWLTAAYVRGWWGWETLPGIRELLKDMLLR